MSAHAHQQIPPGHPCTAGLAPEHLERLLSLSGDRIDATGDFQCREGEAAVIR